MTFRLLSTVKFIYVLKLMQKRANASKFEDFCAADVYVSGIYF